MPRKKLIYTHLYPYHITARSNNKQWFYLPKDEIWDVFICYIDEITKDYGFRCHEFLLMDNHYHMSGSTTTADLGEVFCYFQKSVSRTINKLAGRINHVFGGPYKPSLICHPIYYYHVYKYIYRNPVAARMVNCVQDYKYSTLFSNGNKVPLPITYRPTMDADCYIPLDGSDKLEWLNDEYSEEGHLLIKKGLTRTKFKITCKDQRTKPDLNFR